jgi:hypothetical protein
MSLAEDLRRPFETSAAREATVRSPRKPSNDQPQTAAVVKNLRDARRPTPEPNPLDTSDESLNLLDRASKTVVFILGRYRQLEEHVRQLDAWSKAQIQAAEAAANRWQEAAADSERKTQEAQQQLAAMSRRVEIAERDLKRDKEALGVLQDRIISAFGFGSEAHDALATIEID